MLRVAWGGWGGLGWLGWLGVAWGGWGGEGWLGLGGDFLMSHGALTQVSLWPIHQEGIGSTLT